MTILICVTTFATTQTAYAAPIQADSVNLLLNGGFEEGNYSPIAAPDSWTKEQFDSSSVMLWDNTDSFEGNRSVKISLTTHNDARWMQTVNVEPNTNYRVSGWIKTDYASGTQRADLDAFLFLVEHPIHHSRPLFSTSDWTYVSFAFNSGEETQFTIAAQLGGWGEPATGTAWFDDLEVAPIQASDPHPAWKILLLIYDTVDVTYTDDAGITHRYYSEMTQQEKDQTEQVVTQFVEEDIPALTSGNMIPMLTIRHPEQALTRLEHYSNGGWSPAPYQVIPDRDPAFDSVIVIWDPWVLDDATGETIFIGEAAGLAYWMGTGQTYAAIVSDAATSYGHRNVFRHEWGHSILFFYEAFGTAPKPAVDNHAWGTPETQYVHCPTGEPYILMDETPDDPIPNSIYNNESGFTHDYYSGTTAVQDQPTRCLGITPEAWASGGPVSGPLRHFTPIEKLQLIKNDVNGLVLAGDLAESRAKLLYDKLDTARGALREGRYRTTIKNLEFFISKVEGLVKTGRLAAEEGVILINQATALINELKD
jgi:hypothetical protein